ncbi:hypothetical protein CRM79_06445 [Pantoea agglomerans]|nr:hypothetical protein CRM79_06445 [Pantoea agglomerans]
MRSQATAAERSESGLEAKRMKLSAPAFRLPGSCGLAQQKDKGRIVRQMQGKGLFIVRGGVEMAARGLGVTRYSVCNYLDEIKKTP